MRLIILQQPWGSFCVVFFDIEMPLIIFVGHAFNAEASVANALEGEGSIGTVIAQLIELSTLPDGKSTDQSRGNNRGCSRIDE